MSRVSSVVERFEAGNKAVGADSLAPVKAPKKKRKSILANVVGLVALFMSVFPIYWLIATSLKRDADVRTATPKWLPVPPYFDNYSQAFTADNFMTAMRNSLLITLVAVVVGMTIAFFAAVALGRFWFRGRTFFIVALMLIQMIPGEALFVPYLLLSQDLEMQGKLPTLILVYVGFVLPLSIWMLRGFVRAVPKDIEEAALTDGATPGQAFRKVLFPLIAPGIVATSIFAFLSAWNEFTYAYTLTNNESQYTVPVLIQSFIGPRTADWGAAMAMSVIFSLPAVIFFMFVQRRAVTGLTAGAVKG